MKIGIIQNVTLNDHRSVYSHNIACELIKRGYEVDLILQKTGERLQYEKRPYNLLQIPGKTYSIIGQLQFMLASVTIIKKGNYDIIHAKNPFSSIFSALILKKMGLITPKILYDIRGLWIDFGIISGRFSPQLGIILNKIEKFFLNRCNHIIVISPKLKEILHFRGFDEKKISVIFGDGVDINEIESIKSIKEEDKIKIGYIGTISSARQSHKILEAFKKIKRDHIYLVMVGPIIKPQKFKKLTARSSNILLTGFLPQKKAFQLLKSFTIAVSYHDIDRPGYNVAVPTKILEYMAAGIPIVATDHVMYKNILENGKTAILTRQNPEDFAKGITYLIDNPVMAAIIAENAKNKACEYSIQRVVDHIENVYNHVIG